MALTRDVADDLEAVGQAHLGHFPKRRVRLLRGRGVDARANAALLRRLLQRRHLLARFLYSARTCDQLVDRRHVSLHPYSSCETVIGSANSFGTTRPTWPRRANRPAQSEIAPTAHC